MSESSKEAAAASAVAAALAATAALLRTAPAVDLKSVKPFKTKDEYLYAMKEDLAEWFQDLYDLQVTVDNFFENLDSGSLLCRHANTVQSHMSHASDLNSNSTNDGAIVYRSAAQPGTFQARDNISIFIGWCRKVLGIPDTLIFETEDLVGRKNERSVVLCILEVARKGAKFGVLAPQLIQLEQEIDEEIERENNANVAPPSTRELKTPKSSSKYLKCQSDLLDNAESARKKAEKSHIEVDLMSLDEMVRLILSRCRCEHQYPMIRLSEGKYTYGNNLTPVFLRVLRRHVMVRTGGGWDTLESFLDRHDPCRCNSKEHRGSMAFRNMAAKVDTPVKLRHENGDSRSIGAVSHLGSTDSVPSSESSSSCDTKSKTSRSSSRQLMAGNHHPEVAAPTEDDGIPDPTLTLSLLNDVVSLIETKQTTAARNGIKTSTTGKAVKAAERPKSCKPGIGSESKRALFPVDKNPPPASPSVSKVSQPGVVVSRNNVKLQALNSKSLTSSRENLNAINRTSSRRKSDFVRSPVAAAKELVNGSLSHAGKNTNKLKTPADGNSSRPTSRVSLASDKRKSLAETPNKHSRVAPSKSLNASCENLLLSSRRKSLPFSMANSKGLSPSKSFNNYNSNNATASSDVPRTPAKQRPASSKQPRPSTATSVTPSGNFKRPSSAISSSSSTPSSKRPSSARVGGSLLNGGTFNSRTRYNLDISNFTHSLENLNEESPGLHHFKSQDSVDKDGLSTTATTPAGDKLPSSYGVALRSKPRRDTIDQGLKTRIPAPVDCLKRCSETSLKRADSGVDITGGQDFIAEGVPKNKFFEGDDYY